MSSNGRIPKELLKVFRQAKSFGVVGHVKPDADTLGSSVAISGLLKRFDPKRKVVLANASPIPHQMRFLPRWEAVIAPAGRGDMQGLDCAIYLECSNPERAGSIALPEDFRVTVNIDHHKTGKGFAHINWISPKASSNSEQVYLLYEAFGFKPNKIEAAWLYAGMVSDTGRFQYSMTSPLTHRIAADLLKIGIPHTRIAERLFTIKSVEHLRLLGRALESLKFFCGGKLAMLRLTAKDFAEIEFHATQTEDIVNYGLAPEQAELSFFLKEEPFRGDGVISVSLRSRGLVDVSAIAESFGGGGHRNAAGFEISGHSSEAVERLLVERAEKLLAV
ncbi:MAG: bifunctional oligoribonuclease/PAP phosphatase NrnA [Elusimicrobiota bacterium]